MATSWKMQKHLKGQRLMSRKYTIDAKQHCMCHHLENQNWRSSGFLSRIARIAVEQKLQILPLTFPNLSKDSQASGQWCNVWLERLHSLWKLQVAGCRSWYWKFQSITADWVGSCSLRERRCKKWWVGTAFAHEIFWELTGTRTCNTRSPFGFNFGDRSTLAWPFKHFKPLKPIFLLDFLEAGLTFLLPRLLWSQADST